jgi:hypothetical protein
MKPIKRAYFIALGSNFVNFQRRKQIVIDLNGIKQGGVFFASNKRLSGNMPDVLTPQDWPAPSPNLNPLVASPGNTCKAKLTTRN